MKSPFRLLKRKLEQSRHGEKRLELENLLSTALGQQVRMRPASAKGGYDEIYYGLVEGHKELVIRANNKYKTVHTDYDFKNLRSALEDKERLDREWTAYARLYESGIAPRPMWRNDDAIACRWLDWNRASNEIKTDDNRFWPIIERIVPTVATMHNLGVVHMDLNLGNLLMEPDGVGAVVIDFEYAPSGWLSEGQQIAFDYLKLIDDCIRPRRGGKKMLANIPRLIALLDSHVQPAARAANLDPIISELSRLRQEKPLKLLLQSVFNGLNP